MGLDAQMLFRSPHQLSAEELNQLNHDLVRSFCSPLGINGYLDQINTIPIRKTSPTDFGPDANPPVSGEDVRIPPTHRSGDWYWVGLSGRYYGVGHEKGDIWGTVGIAEWLEFRIPGVEIWYGADVHDFLSPFPKSVRSELVAHFFKVGHGEFANP